MEQESNLRDEFLKYLEENKGKPVSPLARSAGEQENEVG